ncbi:MAG TPA: hypothetical protein VFZ27_15995 [Terriglobia bacterium]|nr:hypothetical protein [Terriglobia bacterium]
MVGEDSPLAVIPGEAFRWRPRVQFIESFRTRSSAVNYALKHGYNLVVERNEGTAVLFDVLLDIDEACTENINLELTETEEVLIEPEVHGRAMLTGLAFCRLCKRSAAALASRRCWKEIYRCGWVRHFDGRARDLPNRVAIPVRRTASRCWWSGPALEFRRWQHRHSHGSAADLAKRSAACLDGLYMREIAPRLRHAVEQYRQADIAGALRRAWNSPLATFSSFATRFAAAAAVFLNPEIAPVILQAASNLRRAHMARAFPVNVEAAAVSRNPNTSQLG